MKGPYYIGVDVGTSSARAALFTSKGEVVVTATQSINIWEPETDFYEQSSDQIWEACCKVIKAVVADVDPKEVLGIGFDATCSLVLLDDKFNPVAASVSGKDHSNIIMWMDHRAVEQAKHINQTHHKVLNNIGGTISPEMQLPKLLWLKQNLPEDHWARVSHFFDLPDYLTWRATGEPSRSLCSLICKWTYQADADGESWDASVFEEVGLEDLVRNNFSKIGQETKIPGQSVDGGVSETAATEMGLHAGVPVAASIIDAQAGALGTLGFKPTIDPGADTKLLSLPITSKLALICGTSTCHMILSENPVFVRGVWGPYYSTMIPRHWLNEGGQSASGKLIDFIVNSHPSYSWAKEEAEQKQVHIFDVLNDVLRFKANKDDITSISRLSQNLHVWPDYHGNRSPLADPTTCGMISGLRLSSGVEDLAIQYLAAVQALAYGTRHIVDSFKQSGHDISLVYICGGLSKNSLFVQSHADILGLPVVLPDTQESVLLGSAILAACASGNFNSIQDAMEAMSGSGKVLYPNEDDRRFHDQKYKVFLSMIDHQRIYQSLMTDT